MSPQETIEAITFLRRKKYQPADLGEQATMLRARRNAEQGIPIPLETEKSLMRLVQKASGLKPIDFEAIAKINQVDLQVSYSLMRFIVLIAAGSIICAIYIYLRSYLQ